MMDRKFYKAEELDFFLETHQTGQADQLELNLPLDEMHLAKKLLGISAISRPDDQFLVKLERQIHATARTQGEASLLKNNSHSNGQSELSTGKTPLFTQPRKKQRVWLPLPAPITGILLRIFYAMM